jgi:hypothetical protein
MLSVLSFASVLAALVIGSACYPSAPDDPVIGGAHGARVTSSSGQSGAPPITFQASISGRIEGTPGTRVRRTWGLDGAFSGGDFPKLVFTWTPPPGATNVEFATAPEAGGPPYVFRNVSSSALRRIEYDLPPYPPGSAKHKLVESLEVSYGGATSLASLTTFMPNKASFPENGSEETASVTTESAAVMATPAPQALYTTHYYQYAGPLDTSSCQSIADLLQNGRGFYALRVPAKAMPSGAEGSSDVSPIAMRGDMAPTFRLTRRPPTSSFFTLPLLPAAGRLTFLENTLPQAPGERWLALAGSAEPRVTCPAISPAVAAGSWQVAATLNLDLPADVGTLTSYLCYEGADEPFPGTAAALGRRAASMAGLDAVSGEGITCLGPIPLAVGALTVQGGVTPLAVADDGAARTIRLPHRLTWMGSGTVVTRVSVDSSLPIPWSLYRSFQSAGVCATPDLAAPITPGATDVNVQPGSFAGPCVWLVGTVPANAAIPHGPYNVKLTATMVPALLGSAWGSDQIWYGGWQPPPEVPAPRAYDYLVPAAANSGGANGTRWLSDLDLLNPGTVAAEVEVACLVKNQANPAPETAQVTVPPGTTVRLTNVLGTTFKASNAALGIKLVSGRVLASSRFYNTASKCGGTYGMYIRGEGPEETIVHGQTARFNLLGYSPTATRGSRVNIGFLNDSANDTEVEIRLYGDAGELLKTVAWTLLPFEHRQFTRIHADPPPATPAVTHGWAAVEVKTPGGRVHAYAMLIDNVSGDPVYMRQGRAVTAAIGNRYDLCITAAANTGGANGTRWVTDLDLLNPGEEDAAVDVACLPKNQANPTPGVERVVVPAGATVRLGNVLGTTFSAANAALGVELVSGSVVAGSRFYNTASACGGTYGMFVPGEGVGRLVASGDAAYFGLLSYSPAAGAGFRVNIGFLNDCAATTALDVDLFGDDGALLKTVAVTLLPYEHRQLTRIHHDPAPATAAVAHGWARVRVLTPGGQVHAYAMLIDNVSGDPVYIDPVVLGGV